MSEQLMALGSSALEILLAIIGIIGCLQFCSNTGMEFSLISNGHIDTLYSSTKLTLQIFQTGAVLEILHAMFGLVRSSGQVTTQQLFSRYLDQLY